MPTTARTRADACPGVVSPHLAADGALARVRLPGGLISASALRAVAGLARDAGDGSVHLTSRGNLQLRGLDPADPRPVRRLAEAGLLPSVTHERVRNVLASPLSGIAGGCADVRGLAAVLDRGLCARPGLAALPGRFLIAIDDGRGDVAGERPDLCWRASTADDGDLLVADTRTGLRCPPAEAPELLLAAAEVFLDLRAEHTDEPEARAWRATELPDAAHRIAEALRTPHPHDAPAREAHSRPAQGDNVHPDAESRTRARPASTEPPHPPHRESPHGWPASNNVTLDDMSAVAEMGGEAVGVGVVLGELSAAQVELLSDVAPEVLVTPWRTLVLPAPVAGAIDRLRAAGLVVDPGHPALRVSACAGAPGCAKSLADVRGDARELIRTDPAGPVHVAGCARRCGAPHTPHVDAVATGPLTYEIDGTSPPGPLRRAAAPPSAPAPPQDRPRSHR